MIPAYFTWGVFAWTLLALFFNCKSFGKTAEFVTNYLSKGRLVAVDGRLDQRSYTDKDGARREAIEIVAESVQGLDKPKPVENEGGDFDPFEDE